MFFHRQEPRLQAEPAEPDAIDARRLQAVLGGPYGEITITPDLPDEGAATVEDIAGT